MTYLITGATGFVGHFLIDQILAQQPDAQIIGIARRKHDSVDSRMKLLILDLNDIAGITPILEQYRPDAIIHLASYSSVGYSWQHPIQSFTNNVNIYLNLLDSVRKTGIKARVLHVGSSEEYGIVDPGNIPITELTPLNPISPYAVARVSQELISKVYVEGYGLDIVLTRSFNHIGPGQDTRFVIPSFITRVKHAKGTNAEIETGDLSIIRDFLDVRDVVKAYLLLLEKGETGKTYNICSGSGQSLQSVLELICELLSKKVIAKENPAYIRPNDNPVIIGNNTKLRESCNWQPEFSLRQSLRDMIEYQKDF